MKRLFYLLAFLIFQFGFSQIGDPLLVEPRMESSNSDSQIYSVAGVEVKPEYEGGIKEFYNCIRDNFKMPTTKEPVTGKVFVAFVVEKDGSLTDIKVLRDVGYGTADEAIKVIQVCKKWRPAMHNGKNVRCSFMLPIAIQTK